MCVDDLRVGANPLMRKLYEIEVQQEAPINNFDILESPHLWRYRQPLSIRHMRMKLQGKFAQSQGQENRQIQRFLEDVWTYYIVLYFIYHYFIYVILILKKLKLVSYHPDEIGASVLGSYCMG